MLEYEIEDNSLSLDINRAQPNSQYEAELKVLNFDSLNIAQNPINNLETNELNESKRIEKKPNLHCFCFFNDYPLIVIGKNNRFGVCFIFCYLLIIEVISIFEIDPNFDYKNFDYGKDFYNVVFYCCIITFSLSLIINPGIIDQKKYSAHGLDKKDMDFSRYKYCDKCDIYVPKYLQTQHCRLCKICVIESHHHNPVFGKCVGKNTILLFYATSITLIFHLATNACLLTYYFGILFFRKIFSLINNFRNF